MAYITYTGYQIAHPKPPERKTSTSLKVVLFVGDTSLLTVPGVAFGLLVFIAAAGVPLGPFNVLPLAAGIVTTGGGVFIFVANSAIAVCSALKTRKEMDSSEIDSLSEKESTTSKKEEKNSEHLSEPGEVLTADEIMSMISSESQHTATRNYIKTKMKEVKSYLYKNDFDNSEKIFQEIINLQHYLRINSQYPYKEAILKNILDALDEFDMEDPEAKYLINEWKTLTTEDSGFMVLAEESIRNNPFTELRRRDASNRIKYLLKIAERQFRFGHLEKAKALIQNCLDFQNSLFNSNDQSDVKWKKDVDNYILQFIDKLSDIEATQINKFLEDLRAQIYAKYGLD